MIHNTSRPWSAVALLYLLLSFHGGMQGSGPDRGRSPVEWGDFPSVRPSVCQSICPDNQSAERTLEPAGWASEPAERALNPVGRAFKQARRVSEEAAVLGGPRFKLDEP